MLRAKAPGGVWVGLTDGECGLPVGDTYFYVGAMPEPCDVEGYFAFVRAGRIEERGGELSGAR